MNAFNFHAKDMSSCPVTIQVQCKLQPQCFHKLNQVFQLPNFNHSLLAKAVILALNIIWGYISVLSEDSLGQTQHLIDLLIFASDLQSGKM